MIYPLQAEIDALVQEKLVSRRKHPTLPLWIYNYMASAQGVTRTEWTPALCDCRGLILDANGEIVGRPFRKFWNYEQVLDQIPAGEGFTVWEKLDGSLGIVCAYQGELVVATRGSFESDQAKWATAWLNENYPGFRPDNTHLFEIIFPENRIVVDYGDREEMVLLAIMDKAGMDLDGLVWRSVFRTAQRFDGLTDFAIVNSDPRFAGREGFVVRWESGFRAKVKAEEYKRLHRLITQCSNRTIWELLRVGKDTGELMDRVPDDFRTWALCQVQQLQLRHRDVCEMANRDFACITAYVQNPTLRRKEFAEAAKKTSNPSLLFSLLDGKEITDAAWKLVEPKWAAPFRKEVDA